MFLKNLITLFILKNIINISCQEDEKTLTNINEEEKIFDPIKKELENHFNELQQHLIKLGNAIQQTTTETTTVVKSIEITSNESSNNALIINDNDGDSIVDDKNLIYTTILPEPLKEIIKNVSEFSINNPIEESLNENFNSMMDNIFNETTGDDVIETPNEMKQHIFYTEEIDENNLKMRNHSLNENDTEIEAAGIDEDNESDFDEINGSRLLDEPEMLIGTTTIFPTLMTRQSKQNKQIMMEKQIKKPKRILLPHESLREYVEDIYLRTPIAVIVDPTINSLEQTKQLWDKALISTNKPLDIILLGLNATGVSVTYRFQNTRTFLAGLNSLKQQYLPGNPFLGIIKAYELIPYDSAVFISAASIPINSELAHHAGIALLKKRIRLYLIWFGDKAFNENESEDITGGVLGKIAIRSGGEIIYMGSNASEQRQLEDNMITLVSDSYRGSQDIDVPIDTTMSNLQIKIDTQTRTATLETPIGEINLKKNMRFTSKEYFGLKKEFYEININLDKFNLYTNKLKLRIIPKNLNSNYCVSVELNREQPSKVTEFESLNGFNLRNGKKFENLRFPSDELTNLTETINVNETKSRQQQNSGVVKGVTKIDMGVQSQLLVAPGMMAQLHFEITNLRDEPIFHSIQVIDDQRFLFGLSRPSIFLGPGMKDTIIVTIRVPQETSQGTRDKITFTCQGSGQTSLSLNLKVVNGIDAQDTRQPDLTWRFGSRCESYSYQQQDCSGKIWSLDVTAQDYETGMLAIKSNPEGILIRVPYTVGSTEPIVATYTASCCQPRVTITAHDLAGNQRTYNIDVRDIYLTEASIAAIVLGLLLLIILIVALIWCIVYICRKRNSASRDLPSYRSHPERRS